MQGMAMGTADLEAVQKHIGCCASALRTFGARDAKAGWRCDATGAKLAAILGACDAEARSEVCERRDGCMQSCAMERRRSSGDPGCVKLATAGRAMQLAEHVGSGSGDGYLWRWVKERGAGEGVGMADVFEELEEEDVWAVMRDVKKERSPKARRAKEPTSPAPPRRLPTSSPRTIHTFTPHADVVSSSGSGSGDWHGGKAFRQSAPVNIPDWSKVYCRKKGSSEGRGYMGAPATSLGSGGHDDREVRTSVLDVGDEEDEGDSMLPPHEWIARKLARNQISSFSVCEGVGRTLKGRDLSRVRNAVLSRTGFLE
ncbi:hypothetical protein Taro_041030 [Colocasia esculenta]|uniref:Uncharacterized protein n=1 Tax=Colocasia esculenta TaxID=4460 RepID=A0A843WKF4_COLES|nr:hypothetical protein [Colocasia esculenta]